MVYNQTQHHHSLHHHGLLISPILHHSQYQSHMPIQHLCQNKHHTVYHLFLHHSHAMKIKPNRRTIIGFIVHLSFIMYVNPYNFIASISLICCIVFLNLTSFTLYIILKCCIVSLNPNSFIVFVYPTLPFSLSTLELSLNLSTLLVSSAHSFTSSLFESTSLSITL